MQALRFHDKLDLRIEDVPAPDRIAPDQLIVKPAFCGICGTDLHEYAAGPIIVPTAPHIYSGAKLPQILGHEFAGEVVEVGRAVTHVRPGDRVSIQPQVFPADDYYARRGMGHLSDRNAVIGLSWAWGGMGELAVVNDYNAYKLPPDVDDVQGAMIEPAAVGVYAVDRGRVKPGSTVLVAGGGPIGILTAMAARLAGAVRVFVSEPNGARRRAIAALDLGLEPFDPSEGDLVARLRAETEAGVGVDVAFECVGNERALDTCIKVVRRRGTVVQIGLHLGAAMVWPTEWALKDISIEGVVCYPTTIWPQIIALIQSGRFPVERVVTARVPLARAVEDGFAPLLDKGTAALKVMLEL